MTAPSLAGELQALDESLETVERDVQRLVDGLTEAEGTWRAAPGTWSIAQCLDHLATANRVYLEAMRPAAARALTAGSMRRRPALPGALGRWFVTTLEPPAKPRSKTRAPKSIEPKQEPSLRESLDAFMASQKAVRAFIREFADIDLARVRFRNPFIGMIRFSLATGLHVIAAHERRHTWQAARVRDHGRRERWGSTVGRQ